VSEASSDDDESPDGPILIFVDGHAFVSLEGSTQADLQARVDDALASGTRLTLQVAAVGPAGYQAPSQGVLVIRGDRVASVAVTGPPNVFGHATTGYVFG
jgi:hypothetical protein